MATRIYSGRCFKGSNKRIASGYTNFSKLISYAYAYQGREVGEIVEGLPCKHKIENNLSVTVRVLKNEIYIYLRPYSIIDSRVKPSKRGVYMHLDGFLNMCLHLIPTLFSSESYVSGKDKLRLEAIVGKGCVPTSKRTC